ncbi:MAG: aminotransferase class I/II-fold pyridoxal phosphate-dependent enzyme, partial [Cycloclasticus sp.]|nr:aminotransferase class I/II-fold pyridoxal phosphate-dependent enzyme [Cycloclasticus sp.]
SDKTSVIFIANPNNPTGTWIDPDELDAFINKIPSNIIIVLDEAYGEYLDIGQCPETTQWIKKYPNLVITRTFSKAYGLAGLRIGYSVSHPDIANLLNRVRHPFNVNSLGLVAAEAALKDEAYIEQSRILNKAGLKQLEQGFKQLGLNYIPSVGNFISVEFGENAAQVYNDLLMEGVIVRPVAGYNMPRHLRVSVGLESENQQCLHALANVII